MLHRLERAVLHRLERAVLHRLERAVLHRQKEVHLNADAHQFGYAHPAYAASLSEFGTPRLLARSGAWVLERPIGSDLPHDAMGCYPLFAAPRWEGLEADLADLAPDLVTLTVVPDPLAIGDDDLPMLRRCFPDLVRSFKQHYVTELQRPPESFVAAHHRRNARKALQVVDVQRCDPSPALVDEWTRLYTHLIRRHDIRGIAAFSRAAFARQFDVPGLTIFRATLGNETVGMALWYGDDEHTYYHLAAYDDAGYRVGAAFAIFWRALGYFRARGVQWIALGAGAGIDADPDDGLSRFKRGWATGTRIAYLCGRIFDRPRYAEIVRARGIVPSTFFPAYRTGEFG